MYHYCPVCGIRVNRNKAYTRIEYKGIEHFLCCPLCQKEFEQDAEKYFNSQKKR